MALASDVDIGIKIGADASDAVKSFLDFEKEVENVTRKLEKDFTDLSIESFGKNLDAQLKDSLGSYEETLRKFTPQLKELSKNLAGGSFDQDDYNRRLKLLSPSLQELLADSRNLGKGFKQLGDEAKETANKTKDVADVSKAVKKELKDVADEAEDAGNSFEKYKKDVDKASDNLTARAAFEKLSQSIGLSAEQTALLGKTLPVVGTAIATITAAVIGAGVALFELARSSAEYATELSKAVTQTGLTLETMSALKVAAEQTNTNFSEVTEAVGEFSKTVADAANGSEEAKEKLKRLGIDPQVAIKDLNGSFEKVLEKIISLQNPVERTAASIDAFGEEGKKLIPLINSFNGDLPSLINKARELGLVLSEEDARAAREFEKSFNLMTSQAKTTALVFSAEFMPEITGVMKDIGKVLVDNRKDFKEWGTAIAEIIRGVRVIAETEGAQKTGGAIVKLGQLVNYANPVYRLGKMLRGVGAKDIAKDPPKPEEYDSVSDFLKEQGVSTDPPKSTGYNTDTGAAKKAEDARKKRLDNEIKGVGLDVQKANIAFEARKTELDASLKAQVISFDDYRNDIFVNITKTEGAINAFFTQQKGLAQQRFSGVELDNALKEIDNRQAEYTKKFDVDAEKATIDIREKKIQSKKVEFDELLKVQKSGIDKLIAEEERQVSEGKKSEEELTQFKEKQAEEELKLKSKYASDYRDFIAQTLQEEAKLRKTNAADLLKNNAEYQKAVQEALKAYNDAEAEKTRNFAEQAKRRKAIQDSLEKESSDTEYDKSRQDLESNLKRNRKLADVGSPGIFQTDTALNLKAYYDSVIDLINLRQTKETERAEKERDDQLKKVKGLSNEKELVEQINDLYAKRKAIIDGEASDDKEGAKSDYANEKQSSVSGSFGGGMFGDFMGNLSVIGDSTIDVADKTALATKSLADSWDFAKNAIGMSVDAMIGGTQQLLQQFILTGRISGQIFKQIAASVISGLVVQAGVKAIFELAEGFAQSAIGNAPGAALHFLAAKTYGVVAGVAAVAAVGLAAFAGGEKSTDSKTLSPTASTQSANQSVDRDKPRIIEIDRIQSQQEQSAKLSRMESTLNALATAKSKEVVHRHEISLERGLIGQQLSEALRNREPIHEHLVELIGDNT